MRGAIPSGWRVSRRTFTGGSMSPALTPSTSTPRGTIRRDEAPVPVDDERRIRLMAAQQLVERLSDGPHFRSVELPLGKGGRVPGRQQEMVAVAQRHPELL